MVRIILKKKEAVELYGSKSCKTHFEKYRKFTNKDIEISLLRTLNQVYESVEIVKQGNSYVYQIGNKREELAVREDKRITNGAWSTPYTKNMDIMVVSEIESGSISENAQTLGKWSLDFGLISNEMYRLLTAKHHKKYREQCLEELVKRDVIGQEEERILFDFISEVQNIPKQLAATLARMKKTGIIDYHVVVKGFVEEGQLVIDLEEDTIKKILALEKELKEYFDVNEWYLNAFFNAPKSREYRKRWKERLFQITDTNGNVIGLSFWYNTYLIVYKERTKGVIQYLEKYNLEVIEQLKKDELGFLNENKRIFHEERLNRVVSEARKRADNFLAEKTRIIELDNSVVEIYGATTKEEKYFYQKNQFQFDSGYYDLYFKNLYTKRIEALQNYYGCFSN